MFDDMTVRTLRLILVFIIALGIGGVVTAQDSEDEIIVDFTLFEGNPVLHRGQEGEWDSASVLIGCIIYRDSLFYMLYGGSSEVTPGSATGRSAVGLATSEDGSTWAKHDANPVLELDTEGGVWPGPCIVEDDMWTLFVTPRFTTMDIPGTTVIRATASHPDGPWTVGEEVIPETSGRWDSGIVASSIVVTEDEYILYYFGFNGRTHADFAVGRATATDGVNFTKYNDPDTNDPKNMDTDPVFRESTGWDKEVMLMSVRQHESGWEMFYTGLKDSWRNVPGHIGYATSDDGIIWNRYGNAPVLTLGEEDVGIWWPCAVVVDDAYYLYFNILPVDHSYQEVGVAIGTIKRGDGGE
jgi:hypothetical protein